MSGSVLVLQHEQDCPPAMVGPWLAGAGLEIEVRRADDGAPLPADLGAHLALVVLGGRMGAGDDAEHPHLLPTRTLMAGTVAAGRPLLGICLGHQLTAVALGGVVTRNPRGRTLGLQPFTPTADGAADPLTSVLQPGAPVLHWNDDVVTRLPPGAVPLAHSPDGSVQAARFGPLAWGVQFHPEVTPEVVDRWRDGRDPVGEAAALASVRERQAELHGVWQQLLDRFALLALGR